jgi:hypothetical protein
MKNLPEQPFMREMRAVYKAPVCAVPREKPAHSRGACKKIFCLIIETASNKTT